MVKRVKKYQAGEGARFITRKAALNKLQLTLRDFRTLCIIKGVYPREPKHRRRAQQGKTGIQTLYLKKDVQFLLHEPLVWKLRELKVHLRRIKRAKSMKDYSMAKRYGNTIPLLDMDQIIKERYPTFIDALRDMDDCLTVCFMFAAMPKRKAIPPHLIDFCRRLTIEFMHVVIAARALRYVFVSIKGIYYQVELRGQVITWIVPHNFSFQPATNDEVDFRTMATFAELYTALLGFVNFRLYHLLNLHYPPQLQGYSTEELEYETVDDRVSLSDRVCALNLPLKRTGVASEETEDMELDQFPMSEDAEQADKTREEYEKVKNLKKLFEGLKVFLSREVPRETLVFVLRCFGAQVSWEETSFPNGHLFSENDESITHQIVDRPKMNKQFISRYYVQPQWVFDSINARQLLPVEKYFIGAVLPPHLSPFSQDYRTHRYVPPEERALNDPTFVLNKDKPTNEEDLSDDELPSNVEDMIDNDYDENDEEKENDEELDKLKNMKVKAGETYRHNKNKERKDIKQMLLLKEKMIRKKYRNLYKSMKQSRIVRQKEIKLLKYKRRLNERKELQEKKALLKAKRVGAALLS
ncbi:pescadillo homolog [Planococcus citri]|uniref:pescadillo homolog n=1 Tax=Planococcus citri TaxID=170843 RepID=UPI0031F7BFED